VTVEPGSINEGDSFFPSFTATTTGEATITSIVIGWGDGTSTTFSSGTSSGSHSYPDDNPTSTPVDTMSVSVTVYWSDDKSASGSAELTISNLNPSVTITSVEPVTLDDPTDNNRIEEGEGFVIKGKVVDKGHLDSHTAKLYVDLNFDGDTDDAGETQTVSLSPSSTAGNFTFEHTVTILDDGAAYDSSDEPIWGNGTLSDPLSVEVRVTDDDTGSGSGSSSANVFNVAPQMPAYPALTYQLDSEGYLVSATLSGTFMDRGQLDFHKVSVNWGDGVTTVGEELQPGDLDFSLSRTFASGSQVELNDIYSLTVDIVDDDGGAIRAAGPRPTAYEVRISATDADEDGEKPGWFIVTISPPPQTIVTIAISVDADPNLPFALRTDGSDYSTSVTTLVFLPNELRKEIKITPVDDEKVEENEVVQLVIHGAHAMDYSSVYTVGGSQRSLTILDDEWRWVVYDSNPSATIEEGWTDVAVAALEYKFSWSGAYVSEAAAVMITADGHWYGEMYAEPWEVTLQAKARYGFNLNNQTGEVTPDNAWSVMHGTAEQWLGWFTPAVVATIQGFQIVPQERATIVNVAIQGEMGHGAFTSPIQLTVGYFGVTPTIPGASVKLPSIITLRAQRGA
jgi:hypothetical protein